VLRIGSRRPQHPVLQWNEGHACERASHWVASPDPSPPNSVNVQGEMILSRMGITCATFRQDLYLMKLEFLMSLAPRPTNNHSQFQPYSSPPASENGRRSLLSNGFAFPKAKTKSFALIYLSKVTYRETNIVIVKYSKPYKYRHKHIVKQRETYGEVPYCTDIPVPVVCQGNDAHDDGTGTVPVKH
jgi:hypothetical protein